MSIDFLLALLKNSFTSHLSVDFLSKEMSLPIKVVEQNLLRLARNDLVSNINRGNVEIRGEQRLNLAIFAIREGADLEKVCRALGWKEFEDLVALVLERNGCRVKKHFRFKGSKRRYEIDVIGLKMPLVFSVECKRWKQSWKKAAMVNIVRTQIERSEALMMHLLDPKDRLGVVGWNKVELMPLVLTLSSTPLKISSGVPVIPIFQFNSFLNEMQAYMEQLLTFKSKLSKQMNLN